MHSQKGYLLALGDGNFAEGCLRVVQHQREKFDPIGGAESAVPAGTLFTGLLLVNIFYWCTNQTIVQRVFGAKSLKEAQKGVLGAALLKLIGPLFLVFPGIIALDLLGSELENPDFAYPMLVDAVLPTSLVGLFGAVMFGAILSSFNSALHSAATLFGLDIYKGVFKSQASDREAVFAGKLFAAGLAIIAMVAAPVIANAPDGLYTLMKQINAIFNIPILAVIVTGMLSRRTSAYTAKVALFLGMAIYVLFTYVLGGEIFGIKIHWLHFAGINFVFLCFFMLTFGTERPGTKSVAATQAEYEAGWRGLLPTSILTIALVLALYASLHALGTAG